MGGPGSARGLPGGGVNESARVMNESLTNIGTPILAWEAGGCTWVAETKSLSDSNQESSFDQASDSSSVFG